MYKRQNQELFFNDAGTALARRLIRIEVEIKVKGVTLDGTELESNPLRFPLDICTGCLISFPPESLTEVDGQAVCQVGDRESEGDLCLATLGRDGNPVPCDLCQLFAGGEQSRALCQP